MHGADITEVVVCQQRRAHEHPTSVCRTRRSFKQVVTYLRLSAISAHDTTLLFGRNYTTHLLRVSCGHSVAEAIGNFPYVLACVPSMYVTTLFWEVADVHELIHDDADVECCPCLVL